MKTIWCEEQFKRISEELKKMSGDVCNKALSLCERGITICEELAKYTPAQEQKTMTKSETGDGVDPKADSKSKTEAVTAGKTKTGTRTDKKKPEELIKEINDLNDGALTFDSQCKKTSNSPAFAAKPPMMSQAEKGSTGHMSASQRASEDARFRIEQSREQLKQVRQSYEKSVENMEKNQKELTDILVEMQNCKITEIDFNTKIKMLVKGLDAMGRVKEQWEKMVHFFQMVSNIIKPASPSKRHCTPCQDI
ncbi:uncharacterized protein AKAME5_002483900 [Lates japonicus]|uniref:Uncharacterized protein n=1 Tax=Lates japonicus TaxID=270547 RepID=A0AAD3RK78_LATJO|nr:uncharacterized protein AKAME5_002483900 [Lates japonicus]